MFWNNSCLLLNRSSLESPSCQNFEVFKVLVTLKGTINFATTTEKVPLLWHLCLDSSGSKISWDSFGTFWGRLRAVVLHNWNLSKPSRIQNDTDELEECGDCHKQHWKTNLRLVRRVLHIAFTWQSWLLHHELLLCIRRARKTKLGFTYLLIIPYN